MFQEIKKRIPNARDVFAEAFENVSLKVSKKDPEIYSLLLLRSMEEAERLYRRYEEEAFGASVEDLFHTENPESLSGWLAENFGLLQSTFMSIFQSRKARAGSTLQDAFSILLDMLKIPYQPQKIVNGKVDFVIPDAKTFRSNPLRSKVVACKRTLRERWTQIIPEARNQGIFYLLTIDPDLSAEQLGQMTKRRVYLIVPASLKNSTYPTADNVITVDEFLRDARKDVQRLRRC